MEKTLQNGGNSVQIGNV